MTPDLRVPAAGARDDYVLGWLNEAQQQAEQWLQAQRAYISEQQAIEMVLSASSDDIPNGMSKVRVPRAKRNIRELVSILSNLRPNASNKTENANFYDGAEVFNKLDKAWWFNTKADRRFRTGFQVTAMLGTGYIGHVWDPDLNGRRRRGDIRTDTWGPNQVYLVHPPADFDLQRCYAVGIRSRVPIWMVQAKYPMKAHLIAPDHGAKGWTQKGLDYVQSFMSSPLRALTHGIGDEMEDRDSIWPTCDVIEWYILDLAINITDHPIEMGEPGTSWHYRVPNLGSLIETGIRGFEGQKQYRKADADDAMIYPLRRKIVSTKTVRLYDSTSEWWHGMVPLSRLRFDDWPTEPLGFPLTRDVAALEEDINELLRGYTDAALLGLDPPMAVDENLVSERLAERMNLRARRTRVRGNLQMGDLVKPLLPADYRRLPNGTEEHIKYLLSLVDHEMGIGDLVALAKAKQVPGADTIEKLLQLAGPLADDITRGVECCMLELGEMRRYLNAQFQTAQRRMEILGEAGQAETDFDFDPGTIVPSHRPDENPDEGPSRYTRFERGQWFCDNFHYQVVPYSMAKRQSLSHKLLTLQLQKLGFPTDPWSMGEDFEIDNVGQPPVDSSTRVQRWVKWQEFLHEMANKFGGQPPGGGKGRGRPNSNKKPPQVKGKDGGSRSTVATS